MAAVGRLGAAREVDLIDDRAIRASKLLPAARLTYYWQTPEARRLYREEGWLRGDGKTPIPAAVRRTKEWGDQADLLLTAIEQWAGHREATERDYFYQKAALFTGLIDLTPAGILRTRAIRALIDFLRHSDLDARSPVALARAHESVPRRCTLRSRVARFFPSSRRHCHPVLSVYARLGRSLGSRSPLDFERER